MSDAWFYSIGTNQTGPVTWETLQELARGGQVSPQTLIWKEGMPEWMPAGTLPGMFADGSAAPAAQLSYATPFDPSISYVQFGGFWRRVGASFIDAIVVAIPFWIVGAVLAVLGLVPFKTGANAAPFAFQGLANLLSLLIGWLYSAFMESSSYQATLVKMVLGLVVTDERGNRIGFGQASGRYFGKILSAIILYIGFLMVAFTRRKQGLHDFLANTFVIKRATLGGKID